MKLFGKLRKAENFTFLNNLENPKLETADVFCQGIAIDLTSSYAKGASFGPEAIMQASHQIEYEAPLFNKSLTEFLTIHNAGILEYPASIEKLSKKKLSEIMQGMVKDTKTLSEKALENGKFLMSFGGEHSICNGIFQAIAEKHGAENVLVLQFDAHLDLRFAYEDQELSHASVMRNACELGFQALQVGIRDHISDEEANFIKKHNLKDWVFYCPTMPAEFYKDNAKELENCGFIEPENILWNSCINEKQVQNILSKINKKFLYITFDIDCLDANEVPGTGTPLPFGLSLKTVKEMLYKIIKHCKSNNVKILGFDINEVSPMMKANAKEYLISNVVTPVTEQKAALLA
ncbi:arginase family protein, partial [archaeon]|nr:arginase family protein [archaeon]